MVRASHPHLASLIFNTPLMIHRPKLHTIIRVLGGRIGVELGGPFDDGDEEDDVSVGAAGTADLPDGIRCIQAYGTLVKRAVGLNAMSGMATYESLSAQLMEAATDPACKAILLDLDSFGGGVDGAFDLSDLIYNVRQTVPIYGIANCHAYSAGYALASACEKLYVTQDGGVGSIGVIAEHADESDLNAKIGVKYTAVTFGAHKNDFSSNAPLSTAALEELQAQVDQFGDMFVALVARNRSMSADDVLATQAACFGAKEALANGLVDGIGTRTDVIGLLQDRVSTRRLVPMPGALGAAASSSIRRSSLIAGLPLKDLATAPASGAISTKEDIPNMSQQVQPAPDATRTAPIDAEALRQEVTKDALAKFAARQTNINALCKIAGAPELAASFIADASVSIEQVQEKLLDRRHKADASELETQFLPQGAPDKAAVNNPNRLTAAVQKLLAKRKVS